MGVDTLAAAATIIGAGLITTAPIWAFLVWEWQRRKPPDPPKDSDDAD